MNLFQLVTLALFIINFTSNMADVPIPSIETHFDDNLQSPIIFTPPSSSFTFSTPVSPGSDGGKTPKSREGNSNSQGLSQRNGLTADLQNMRLTDQNGLESMSELHEALGAVRQRSDSSHLSPSPEEYRGSPALDTPRQGRRSRRLSDRGDKGRHIVSEEEMPKDAFHTQAFQQAFKDAKQLMSNLESVLRSSSIHKEPDSTIGRLHEESVALAAFQYPASRIVGFVGESGVGKQYPSFQ